MLENLKKGEDVKITTNFEKEYQGTFKTLVVGNIEDEGNVSFVVIEDYFGNDKMIPTDTIIEVEKLTPKQMSVKVTNDATELVMVDFV